MEYQLTHSEENYLKEIFHLSGVDAFRVSTNNLAARLNSKASSITDMLQKLAEKELVSYVKYKGCNLTDKGEGIAVQIIRKHRLWETFLVMKLNFGWEEVHDIAEQLEHIDSTKLIDSLDHFLDYPKFDPHGDPIPDKDGKITYRKAKIKLSETVVNSLVEIVSVNEDSASLLTYLEKNNLVLGICIRIIEKYEFDKSMRIALENGNELNLSKKVIENIGVKFISKT
ncbi:metal-dependent transcriptional regulator [Crocinitomix catalasitica]|uniref:metal-dependent transcriptional regulator n=1 Tax=Crocinitomix catalasitica TaxID=184607 RepID=UPI0004842A75|nr:metal-dependent transcriptional regulator [Crocinitomix catalasitica]